MMDTIFCGKCGQANLEISENCTKCNEFLKTGNLEKTQTSRVKNNNIYWLVGGLGLVVFGGTFLFSILGVGAYFYLSAKNSKPITQPIPAAPQQQPKVTNVEQKDDTLSRMTNDDVQKYISEDLKVVGKYKLFKTGTPKSLFTGAKTEQFGMYSSDNSKRDLVLLIMATYLSVADSKLFVARKIAEVNKSGGKIISYKDLPEGSSLIYEIEKGSGQIMRCSKGICFNIQSTANNDTAEFYKAFENRK